MYNNFKRKRFNTTKFIIIIIAICLIGAIGFGIYKFEFHDTTYKITVTDKQVKKSGDSNDKYLVYTKLENGSVRVFEDTDTFIRGKFNSSDVYAELEVGKTYIIKVNGYRNELFSWYENILSVKEIN